MKQARRIRILVADDHAVLRAGLRLLLNSQPDMKVVAEAASADEAIAAAVRATPEVTLLDLSMPGSVGTDTIGRVRAACPSTRVIVLTMHDDPIYARAAFSAGAAGYVPKRAADRKLVSTIRAVHRQHSPGRGKTLGGLDVAEPTPRPPDGDGGPLSPRELQVLTLLARGHTNREIAARIKVGTKTVETYRQRLAVKLGLRTRADIVAYALEAGILAAPSRTR